MQHPTSPLDLFQFTMQQLAPNPLRYWEGDPQTVRTYLRHWLHRSYHASEQRPPLAAMPPGSPLKLDASGWARRAAGTADFYGLPFPVEDLAELSTLQDVEAYVHRQFLKVGSLTAG